MSENNVSPVVSMKIEAEDGVKYESIDEFASSLFSNVYYEAFINTWRLIERSREYKRDDNLWKRDRLYNTIPFWGPRGMGKTSAMRSFLGELDKFSIHKYRDYYGEMTRIQNKGNRLPSPEEMEKCRFVFVECIDASLLAEEEDIFEVILAKMLGSLLKEINKYSNNMEWRICDEQKYLRYKKADVITKFGELHKYLQNMRDIKNRQDAGTGAVEILKNLSGSLDLREKFKELVPLYLEVMSAQEEGDSVHKLLVISIDDIDMKMKGYNMLEQLHRYFMIPDVLIYVTVAESELFAMCYQHFVSNVGDNVTTVERQKKLAKAYIDKVLPFSKRIYMPTMTANGKEIRIEPDGYDIKKTILWKIAKRTGVYFDGCGVKRHFYEPDNIRNLVNLISVLDMMDELDPTGDSPWYAANMEALMDDITCRLTADKLDGERRDTFSSISEINIERQGNSFAQTVYNFLTKGKFKDDYTKYGYSYGELLRGLYTLGREDREEKKFVHCVLALETAELSDLYMRSTRTDADEDEAAECIRRLKTAMGGSVCGSWGNKLVPPVDFPELGSVYVGIGDDAQWGYIKGRYMREYARDNTEGSFKGFIYEIHDVPADLSMEDKFNICMTMLGDEKMQLVRSLELLLMFLTNIQSFEKEQTFYVECTLKSEKNEEEENPILLALPDFSAVEQSSTDDEEEERLKREKEAEERGKIKLDKESYNLSVIINSCQVTFDILGFVINAMEYEKFFERVADQLERACVDFCGGLEDSQKRRIRLLIEKNSLKGAFSEWRDEYSYAALPIYSTDIIYNVLKRAKRMTKARKEHTIQDDQMLNSLKEAYENIMTLLKKEDEYYHGSGETDANGCGTRFEETFKNCPVVDYILNEKYSEQFEDAFCGFVKAVKLHETIAGTEDILGGL